MGIKLKQEKQTHSNKKEEACNMQESLPLLLTS